MLVDALMPGMRRKATRHSARSHWRLLSDLTQFISHFNTQGCFRRDRFHRGVHKGPGWLLLLLLAPQSGVHRRGAHRDFQPNPICTVYYVLFLLGVLYHKAGSHVCAQEESEQIILGFVKLTNYPIDKLPKRCVNPIQEVVHKTLNSSAT